MTYRTLAMAGLMLGCLGSAALAQQSAPAANAAKPGAAAEAPLRKLRMAHELADYARAMHDPLGLLVAARLIKDLQTKEVHREGEAPIEPTSENALSARALSEEAVALSAQDATIVALAADLMAAKAKGHVNGVAVSKGVLAAGKTDTYKNQKFEAGHYAEASVEALGAGNGEIRLSVFDEAGNLICRDPNPSSTSYCGWWPKQTQGYTLKLESLSEVKTAYRVSTN